MNKTKVMNLVKYSMIFMLALLVVFSICSTSQVADAVLPLNYVDNYQSQNWYSDDLRMDEIKEIVNGWIENEDIYDFEYLEEHPIIVAVIDSGINFNHEIFLGQYDQYGQPTDSSQIGKYDVFLRDDDGSIVAYNAVSNSSYLPSDVSSVMDDDEYFHGTHVCGIISILIHELDLEKYIKILPIKASQPGTGDKKGKSLFTTSDLQRAINFALQKGAKVVNMSLAGSSGYDLVTQTNATEAIFCAAAGNESNDEGKKYPAASDNVIGVMGYTSTGNMYTNSNYGGYYDLVAPALDILSANGKYNDIYKKMSGTSMASPIVAFGAALATAKYFAIENGIGVKTTVKEITNLVKNSYTKTIRKSLVNYKVFDLYALASIDDIVYSKILLDSDNDVQTIDDVSVVNMHLFTYPSSTNNKGTVYWTVTQGTKTIKTCGGFSVSFLPLKEVSKISVNAVWTYGGQEYESNYEVTIKYIDFSYKNAYVTNQSIKEDYQDNLIVGYQVLNKLYGIDYVDPSVIANVMWYVDGYYIGTNGASFTYLPTVAGEHKISAKLNNIIIAEFTANYILEEDIPKEKDDSKQIIVIVLIVVASVLALAVLITIIMLIVRKKKLTKEMQAAKEEEVEADLIDLSGIDEKNVLKAKSVEEDAFENESNESIDENFESEVLESEVIDSGEDK